MLPSLSRTLAEAISIAFFSLQQRKSISLASQQLRFPVLICNKLTAEAWICLASEVATVGAVQNKMLLNFFCKFLRETAVYESLFNKVFLFIKKRL